MLSDGELKDMSEDLIFQIEKNVWIKNYEIFLQFITKADLNNSPKQINTTSLQHLGVALRLISTSKRLREISFSNSMISNMASISEPKTTQKPLPISEFPILRAPRITSIEGDGASNFDQNRNFDHLIFPEITDEAVEDNVKVTRKLEIILEKRIITNSGSITLQDNSLFSRYQVTHQVLHRDEIHHGTESFFGRNLDFKPMIFDQTARISLGKSMMKHPQIWPGDIRGVLLQPLILGAILSSFIYKNVLIPQSYNSWEWLKGVQIYDDPHRAEGYYSTIFDDEGTLTKSKLVLDDGQIINTLNDLKSSNWQGGGNGFRSARFQPLVRSYKYPISRQYTNLAVYGGVGKGENFTGRKGIVLEIKNGNAYTFGDGENPVFVIHCQESYLWKDGEFLGPSKKAIITGNLSDLMRFGQLSADQLPVVGSDIPGSIYNNWIHIQGGHVSIRWN